MFQMRELIEYNRKNNMLLQKNTLQEVDERLRRSIMNNNFNTIDSRENGRIKWRIEHNGLQIRYIWIIKKK